MKISSRSMQKASLLVNNPPPSVTSVAVHLRQILCSLRCPPLILTHVLFPHTDPSSCHHSCPMRSFSAYSRTAPVRMPPPRYLRERMQIPAICQQSLSKGLNCPAQAHTANLHGPIAAGHQQLRIVTSSPHFRFIPASSGRDSLRGTEKWTIPLPGRLKSAYLTGSRSPSKPSSRNMAIRCKTTPPAWSCATRSPIGTRFL